MTNKIEGVFLFLMSVKATMKREAVLNAIEVMTCKMVLVFFHL